MAVSQQDKNLWNAARVSLSEFAKIYDPNNRNPSQTLTEYNRYKGIRSLSDLDSGSSSSGNNQNNSSGGANLFQKGAGGIIGVAEQLISSAETQYMPSLEREYTKVSGILGGLLDDQNNLIGATEFLQKVVESAFNELNVYFEQQSALLKQVNRGMGLTGQMSKDLRDELTKANPELVRLGIGFEELARSAETLVANSGRFISLNRESWKEAGAAASAYVGTLSDLVGMFPTFEKVGIGAADVSEQIEVIGNRSLSLGLQSQKTVADLGANLSKLNEYGFKNGVQGMAEMVRKSTEFRMNMQSVYSIADKVFNPEGAIEVAANLQAIGGAIGDFNDPLKLMYMATNDVEGLQDALIGVAGSLATYNEEQGRFEITGANLRKAKALAQELGVSYEELASGAIAAAERSSAATSLLSSGLDLDDEQKRFLTNISTMKDGQMTIQLNSDRLQKLFDGQTEIALDTLSDSQLKMLTQYQDEFKKLSPEDIVRKQANDVENIGRDLSYLVALARVEGGTAAMKLAEAMNMGEIAQGTRKIADAGGEMIPGSAQSFIDGLSAETKRVQEKLKKDEEAKNSAMTQSQSNTTTLNGHITHSAETSLDWLQRGLTNPALKTNFATFPGNTYTDSVNFVRNAFQT